MSDAVHDPELVRLLELAIMRVRRGETLALAMVEVQREGLVTMVAEGSGYFHELHSGIAQLAVRLAIQRDERGNVD